MCIAAGDGAFAILSSIGLLLGAVLVRYHDGSKRIGAFNNYWDARAYSGVGRVWYWVTMIYAVALPMLFFGVLPGLRGSWCV
jgi:hypothetical protein